MSQIKVNAADFTIRSAWTCSWGMDSSGDVTATTNTASLVSKTITFKDLGIPAGAKITSAKVHSKWRTTHGAAVASVNGSVPDGFGFVALDLSSLENATAVDVVFRFRSRKDDPLTHVTGPMQTGVTYTQDHTGQATITEVYLLIEYSGGSTIYHAEDGQLVPYQLYHAEDGQLVPYQLYHAEDGQLVPY